MIKRLNASICMLMLSASAVAGENSLETRYPGEISGTYQNRTSGEIKPQSAADFRRIQNAIYGTTLSDSQLATIRGWHPGSVEWLKDATRDQTAIAFITGLDKAIHDTEKRRANVMSDTFPASGTYFGVNVRLKPKANDAQNDEYFVTVDPKKRPDLVSYHSVLEHAARLLTTSADARLAFRKRFLLPLMQDGKLPEKGTYEESLAKLSDLLNKARFVDAFLFSKTELIEPSQAGNNLDPATLVARKHDRWATLEGRLAERARAFMASQPAALRGAFEQFAIKEGKNSPIVYSVPGYAETLARYQRYVHNVQLGAKQ